MKRRLADFAQMITHTMPLSGADAAHDPMRRGEAMKVALEPHG